MSELRRALADYIALRGSLGFRTEPLRHWLSEFVRYVEQSGGDTITTEAAIAWATTPTGTTGAWHAERLRFVRGFARYLQAIDASVEVPPTDALAGRHRRVVPYLYSDAEIASLMAAAQELPSPVLAATYQTMIGLLAITGMRVGETIALDRTDVDLSSGVLMIRHAKFGKTRQILLHPSTVQALSDYAVRRDRLCRCSSLAFFVSSYGTRLFYTVFRVTFNELARQAGLQPRSAACRPRPHDLRHSFAVRTLLEWYRDGVEVMARLPALSTWLGHVDPASTYWYLSCAPELFALVAERLESANGGHP